MRRAIIIIALALLPLASPDLALAHGVEQSYNLPVPLWLYLYGAAAAVLISFVPIGLFVGREERAGGRAPREYPRFNLLRVSPLRVFLTGRPLLSALRLLSVTLFLLVVLSGLFGAQGGDNLAPTFVWITWWVGLGFFTAFVGNVWALVNPWKILFEWADGLARRFFKGALEVGEPYPVGWGVWPALALYFAFVWIENVFQGSSVPLNIALFALWYSFITWSGMVLYGKDAWLRGGEAFSVFFGILARFAPAEARVKDAGPCRDCGGSCGKVEGGCVNCYECLARVAPENRELNLRPPAVGLARAEPVPPGGMAFVVLVLAGVTYDGLLATPLWVELVRITPVTQTLGLVGPWLLCLAAYLGFVKLSQISSGSAVGAGRLAVAYVYSLVPIAIAYQVAHYYTLFLIQGQAIIIHLSDPFGWGWDLFGTAGYQIRVGIVDAAFLWYSQVVLIVAGHILAVYLAHLISLRSLPDPKGALRSQYPMLVLMVLYTISSLWILSQPIVE